MKNKKFDFDKRLLIVLIVVIVLFVVLQTVNTKSQNKYVSMKQDETKKYVYTKYQSTVNNAYVPFINIVGTDVNNVNNEIVNDATNYLASTDKNKTVTYYYNQSNNIVSVVLIYREMIDSKLTYKYKTYVFDLSNNAKKLSDSEILKIFNFDTDYVNKKMASIMKNKYADEVNNGIIDKNECDYSCYLKLRGISNYTDNANYYIEDSKLVVYKAFDVYSKYEEEKYFTRDDFKFYIN